MKYRAGILAINPDFLGDILRFPKGNEVREARIGRGGVLELIIEGPMMPEISTDLPPPIVNLLLNVETRPGDVETGGYQRRVTAWFVHAPEIKWTIRPWEIAEQ